MDANNLMTVTLLGTSDVHGFFMNWDYAKDQRVDKGGLSKISRIYKQIKKENPHSLILDCGDLIQGNNAEMFLDERHFPGIDVINKIGYEIYNMGNHEFNFGMPRLKKVLDQFKGVPMMGNLYDKEGKRLLKGLYIRDFGPVRLAFVSLTTPLVKHFEEKSGNLKDYVIEDADLELKKLLAEADTYKPHAIIGVFHMGDSNENEISNTGVRDLMDHVSESHKLDAIFGGHMHKKILELWLGDCVFMEPGSRGEGLNRLDLTFDLAGGPRLVNKEATFISVDETFESDPEIEGLLEASHKKIRAYVNEHVGYVKGGNLRPDDSIRGLPEVKLRQTPITEFFLDVMASYSKADVVSVHLDNPYPQMPEGEIKRKHIYNSYSYAGGEITNYLVKVRDLKAYMEWSAGYFNQSQEGDFTISFASHRLKYKYSTFDIFGNVKYEIDLKMPFGSRIKNLRRMDGQILLDDEEIVLGLNKFRMDYLKSENGPLHGRDFNVLWSSLKDKSLGFSGTIRNLSIDYFKHLPEETYYTGGELGPLEAFRWQILSHAEDEVCQKAICLLNMGLLDYDETDLGCADLSIAKNIYDKISFDEYIKINNKFKIFPDNDYRDLRIIDLIGLIEASGIKLDKDEK